MAKRTVVVLEDDLDGGPADETVTFALDGVSYEIDLSSSNAGIVLGCATCHNGVYAQGKPGDHPRTAAACETCHKRAGSWSR